MTAWSLGTFPSNAIAPEWQARTAVYAAMTQPEAMKVLGPYIQPTSYETGHIVTSLAIAPG